MLETSHDRSDSDNVIDSVANDMDARMAAKNTAKRNTKNAPQRSERPDVSERASPAGNAGDLDSIREILFGAVAAEHSERFARIEHQIETQIDAMQKAFEQQLADLGTDLSSKIDNRFTDLQNQLRESESTQNKTREKIQSELRAETDTVSQSLQSSLSETRNAFESSIESLTASMTSRLDNIDERVEHNHATGHQMTAQLSEGKIDRSALATLFASLSQQIDLLTPPAPQSTTTDTSD